MNITNREFAIEQLYGLIGFFMFVFAIFFSVILYYIIPPIINMFFTGTTNGVFMLILLLLMTVATVVVPTIFAYNAITKITNKKINVVLGAIWAFLMIILTYVGWYMVPAVANTMPHTYLTALFWIGFVIQWTTLLILIPAFSIIKGAS